MTCSSKPHIFYISLNYLRLLIKTYLQINVQSLSTRETPFFSQKKKFFQRSDKTCKERGNLEIYGCEFIIRARRNSARLFHNPVRSTHISHYQTIIEWPPPFSRLCTFTLSDMTTFLNGNNASCLSSERDKRWIIGFIYDSFHKISSTFCTNTVKPRIGLENVDAKIIGVNFRKIFQIQKLCLI